MKITARPPYVAISVLSVFCSVMFGSCAHAQIFRARNLVSDIPHTALHTNTNLLDPVALVQVEGKVWIANDGQGRALGFLSSGRPTGPVVNVPSPYGGNSRSPGIAYNPYDAFFISSTNSTDVVTNGPSRFLIASYEGFIAGYNPAVDSNAVMVVDNTWTINTSYRALVIFRTNNVETLFVTNFRGNMVEAYDSNFNLINTFTDPNLPPNYAPFGIAVIRGRIFVTFSLQADNQIDAIAGPGHGYVSVFDENGVLLSRFASEGVLDTPYGIAVAPATFGKLRGAVLIANHGDGAINAFHPITGEYLATLHSTRSMALTMPGLYGLLAIGNSLFFTASVNDADGTFGVIRRR